MSIQQAQTAQNKRGWRFAASRPKYSYARGTRPRARCHHSHLHQVGPHTSPSMASSSPKGGCQRSHANRSTGILIQQSYHQVAVHFVEAAFINTQHLHASCADLARDAPLLRALPQNGARRNKRLAMRCAAAAPCNFLRAASLIHLDVQNFRRAVNDDQQIRRLVKIQTMYDAKSRT